MLDADSTSVLAVVSTGLAGLALLLIAVLLGQLRRLRWSVARLTGGERDTSLVGAMQRQHTAEEALRREMARTHQELAAARADLSTVLRHVAVVRYDAFEDMGGQLSFSAVLLDDAGDGLVLTNIAGRSEARTYAKGVVGGVSDHSLSPEEQQAISYATHQALPPGERAEARRPRRRLTRA